jgi:hypothetical protein
LTFQIICFKFKAGDLVDVLLSDEEGRFATLVVAVQAAELVETLQGGNMPIRHNNLNVYELN